MNIDDIKLLIRECIDEEVDANREKRIKIAQTMVLDRYLEPVIDASEEAAYLINNILREEIITGEDIRSSLYHTSGSTEDVIDRLENSIYFALYNHYGYDDDSNFIPDMKDQQFKQIAKGAIKKAIYPQFDSIIGVFSKNIPLLRKVGLIDKLTSQTSNKN